MKYWIKERDNYHSPVYYVGVGQMSAKDAKRRERPLHGSNVMHGFKTKSDYEARIAELIATGNHVHR